MDVEAGLGSNGWILRGDIPTGWPDGIPRGLRRNARKRTVKRHCDLVRGSWPTLEACLDISMTRLGCCATGYLIERSMDANAL